MKKHLFLFMFITIVTLAVLMVLNICESWDEEELFAPPVIALFVIFSVLGAVKKKKILSTISIILAGVTVGLCLGGAAVALTWHGCDWINLVNVVWYGCYGFISMGVVISICFSEEKRAKTGKLITAIMVTPVVLYFLRFLTGRLWESYFESYLFLLLFNLVVEELLAVLTVFGTVKKKKILSVIALALGGLRLLGTLGSFILLLVYMRYYINMRFYTEAGLFMTILEYIFILPFYLSTIILNCKSFRDNRIVRIKVEATCLQCGGLLVPGKKFCTNCGAKISVENETQNTEEKGE